ncbi:uncharacterized protein LOC142537503 [Primulina tabacum]|uniref:uncharacterized protein LOC142537503 n=1 Tax=Primulina tabacum TaxID=48773 RepID=UPI003F599280
MTSSFMEPYMIPASPPATNPASSSSQDNTFLLHTLMYMALLLLIEFAFIFVFAAISNISSVAAILISAASCSGKHISFQDLFSMIAKRWKKPWTTGFRGSRSQPARYSGLVVFLVVFLSVMYPNILTISISILSVVIAVILALYSSVGWVLAMVASVVEEGCDGKEALEKGEQLAKGHRVHGFLLNIFFNLVLLIPFLGCWWIFGDKVLLDFPLFWLFMVNFFSLVKMLVTVEYTLLYFECKEYHGEDIEVFGDNLQYTEVPSDDHAQV